MTTISTNKPWIRGVNIGGWLVLERYIVPYQFAITDCHLRGELCWYPGALSAPDNITDYDICDINQCHAIPNYPGDEWTLGQVFLDAHSAVSTSLDTITRTKQGVEIAERWFDSHFENFLTENDMIELVNAGVTHVRIPIPHFILGDVLEDEPWIVGKRWYYFKRMCLWARKYHLQVWPDIHTAPGSQNGFDNSGQQRTDGWATCTVWCNNQHNIDRTLYDIDTITKQMIYDNISDVVTGFGLLNEPFKDCNRTTYEAFLEKGKNIVRTNLGEHVSIYISDMFVPAKFNDGKFWLHGNKTSSRNSTDDRLIYNENDNINAPSIFHQVDDETINDQYNNPYHDTYLDSHYYQVFDANMRNLSPKQHIAYTCQYEYYGSVSCCYEKDYSIWSYLTGKHDKAIPNNGIRRIFGEWSAAYNILTGSKLDGIMTSIATNGTAIEYDRILSPEEKQFLLSFVQAQMVVFESQQVGVSAGWFFWTIKMEGNAFAEWNFLLGIQQGWIPIIPPSNISSESLYGSCYDILLRIPDNDTIGLRKNYPDPNVKTWSGVTIDDDVVISRGESLIDKRGNHPLYPQSPLIHNKFGTIHRDKTLYYYGPNYHIIEWIIFSSLLCCCLLLFRRKWINNNDDIRKSRNNNYQYTEIKSDANIITEKKTTSGSTIETKNNNEYS